MRAQGRQSALHVAGPAAVVIFVVMLLAFVLESELTQYVQTTLGYRQPFFLFYLVHSSFSIIFPLHLIYLLTTTNHTAVSLIKGLAIAIADHLSPHPRGSPRHTLAFPYFKFIRLCLALTIGVTCPALLWFAAVSLASVSDVTAIWNTNAFFAYIISVKLFKLKWETRKLVAVVLATAGTLVVVYGGTAESSDEGSQSNNLDSPPASAYIRPTAPLIGNLLTLIASFGYGLYQVLYKIYAALPSDPEVTAEDRAYQRIASSGEDDGDGDGDGDDRRRMDPEVRSLRRGTAAAVDESVLNSGTGSDSGAVYPPPFGFHPNALTSMLGIFTALILWIPIPFFHYTGIEPFRMPPDFLTGISITGIALSGVAFNASFMVLLGVWGPIIVSVGNLLTIVLVLISDILFGAGLEAVTFWSLLGSGVIVIAFGVLAYDMFVKETSTPLAADSSPDT